MNFLFNKDNLKKYQEKNPGMKLTELIKLLSQDFKKLPEKQRLVYEIQYKKNREEYEKKMEEWNAKYGALQKEQIKMKQKRSKSMDVS